MQKQHQHKFVGHRQHFQKVPLQQRSEFRKKLLQLQPIQGNPKIFKIPYPNQANWIYNNVKINYYFIQKSNKPKAIFFSFHGMNSHGGSSGYLGTNIAQNCNINVYAMDFKNFGQSQGDCRGYIPSLNQSVAQAEAFIDFVIQKYNTTNPKPKIIISGLSFGGTICFKLAINKPKKYDYMILFSPALRQVKQAIPMMKKLGKAIGYLFPTLALVEPKFTDGTKYNMQSHIKSDPNNYTGKMIPGSVRTVLNAMQQVQSQYHLLQTPYILIQSGADKLVDVFAPFDLEKQSKTNDKTTIYCKDMWHSVFSQEEIQYIVPIVSKWIQKRIK